MEFRDALKGMRKELGITQAELALSLHINSMTVSRWELGKSYPNPSVVSLLLGYAYTHSVKPESVAMLKKSLNEAAKQRIKKNDSSDLSLVEHSSLIEIIEEAPYPIYVCSLQTDRIIYANKKAVEMSGFPLSELRKLKCYKGIMHMDTPCCFCSNEESKKNESECEKDALEKAAPCRMREKLIRWNGREARVRYLLT